MPTWKKNIFVRVISYRIANEDKTAEAILLDYPALTEGEISELLNAILAQ
jgi:uncharacterized protein (DUF433 family)